MGESVSRLRLRGSRICHGGEFYGGRVQSLAGEQYCDEVVV